MAPPFRLSAAARAAATLAAAGAVGALVALAFDGHAFVNYDTAYALLWGEALADGRDPALDLPLAPTPHPLANAAAVVLGEGAVEVLSFLFLGLVAVLAFRLGAVWFGAPAGALAALIVITREPVLSFGLRAYVDLPYLALVLGALLVEARRPRAGWPVLALLALAGLLRPEAWLFSGAYLVWLWVGGERDLRLVTLAAAAPVLWVVHDLALTGEPLYSLTGTRENAGELGRVTGLQNVPLYGPRRLGEIVREPVLVGAVGGLALALGWFRRRTALLVVAEALAVLAFGALALAGLPIITRYLLLPATLAAILCGAGALGWARLAPGEPGRRAWMAFGALVAVLLVLFAPSQADRLRRLERSIAIQERILADLEALPAAALRCRPVAVPNRRPVPHLALAFGLDPARVRVGAVGAARTYVGPSSRAVAERFIFDRRDPVRVLPRLPPGFRPVAGNASWTVRSRGC